MAENNTELQGKTQSCVTVKIKEYNLQYEIPKQYLISIIQNFTPGTNSFIVFILISLYHALKGIFHSLELLYIKNNSISVSIWLLNLINIMSFSMNVIILVIPIAQIKR